MSFHQEKCLKIRIFSLMIKDATDCFWQSGNKDSNKMKKFLKEYNLNYNNIKEKGYAYGIRWHNRKHKMIVNLSEDGSNTTNGLQG